MKSKRRKNKLNSFSILLPLLTVIGFGIAIMISSNYEKNWLFNWSDIRKDIKDSIEIADRQRITSGIVGYSATSTKKEVQRRKWIMKNAAEQELLKLIEYPSGTVKVIAYEGLIKKENYKEKAKLISKSISDDEFMVYYQSGCIGSELRISEYLMRYVLNIDKSIPPSLTRFDRYGLTQLEEDKILDEYKKQTSHNSFVP